MLVKEIQLVSLVCAHFTWSCTSSKEISDWLVYDVLPVNLDKSVLTPVNEIISKYDQNSLEKYYFDAIDNVENRYQLNEVIKLIKRNLIDKNSNDISLTDTYDYLTLDESQNLEKDKLILKLDILNDRISNKFSNRLFIESLKFAFASS